MVSFIDLPPEIRNQIYIYAFSLNATDIIPSAVADKNYRSHWEIGANSSNLRPLLTCRTIYEEARALAYSHTPIFFRVCYPPGYAHHGLFYNTPPGWVDRLQSQIRRDSIATFVRSLVITGHAYGRIFHEMTSKRRFVQERIAALGLDGVERICLDVADQRLAHPYECTIPLALGIFPSLRSIVAIARREVHYGPAYRQRDAFFGEVMMELAAISEEDFVERQLHGENRFLLNVTHYKEFNESKMTPNCIGIKSTSGSVRHVEVFLGETSEAELYISKRLQNGHGSCDSKDSDYCLGKVELSCY